MSVGSKLSLEHIVKDRGDTNRHKDAHNIHAQLVRRPSDLVELILHLGIHILYVLVDIIDAVRNLIQHNVLPLDLLGLHLGDLGQVLDALSDLINLLVEFGIAVLDHL